MRDRSSPLFEATSSPSMNALATLWYCPIPKISVTLTEMPLPMSVRMAMSPGSVAGTLIIRLGRAMRATSSRASLTVAWWSSECRG
jgi:hypothetical protein